MFKVIASQQERGNSHSFTVPEISLRQPSSSVMETSAPTGMSGSSGAAGIPSEDATIQVPSMDSSSSSCPYICHDTSRTSNTATKAIAIVRMFPGFMKEVRIARI